MQQRNGELDGHHIADGEQIPSRIHAPREQATQERLRPRGSVVPRGNPEGDQGWSEGSEKHQQPANCRKRGNRRRCPVGDRCCGDEAGARHSVGKKKEFEERTHRCPPNLEIHQPRSKLNHLSLTTRHPYKWPYSAFRFRARHAITPGWARTRKLSSDPIWP